MNLGEFFSCLSYDVLANLSIGGEGSGSIPAEHQPRIANFTDKALTAIYSKVAHKVDYVKLALLPNVQRYELTTAHNTSDSDVANTALRYILDTESEPFDGRLIKILSISKNHKDMFGQPTTIDLALNDRGNPCSITSLSYNTIMVPVDEDEFYLPDDVLTIEYQAQHPKIESPINLDQEIFLAPLLEEALAFNVAARVYGSMNGEANTAKGLEYQGRYDALMATVELEDLAQSSTFNSKDLFKEKGFI